MGGDPQLLPRCLHRAGREKPPTSSSLSRSSRLQPLAWDHYREFNRGFCNIVQGVESQRQWSDLAIARTTPCLLALFSLVTLFATDLHRRGKWPLRSSAWYCKPQRTFSDAIAAVRQQLWKGLFFGVVPSLTGPNGKCSSAGPTLDRGALLCRVMDKVELRDPMFQFSRLAQAF
jgi:hypothetical protein